MVAHWQKASGPTMSKVKTVIPSQIKTAGKPIPFKRKGSVSNTCTIVHDENAVAQKDVFFKKYGLVNDRVI